MFYKQTIKENSSIVRFESIDCENAYIRNSFSRNQIYLSRKRDFSDTFFENETMFEEYGSILDMGRLHGLYVKSLCLLSFVFLTSMWSSKSIQILDTLQTKRVYVSV